MRLLLSRACNVAVSTEVDLRKHASSTNKSTELSITRKMH
uniref:Uncharacterized protein n=1 Tax=Arundo donax TaxID=35708 RepID=A0A0A9F824_ARUDO